MSEKEDIVLKALMSSLILMKDDIDIDINGDISKKKEVYYVKEGDTLFSIAKLMNLSLDKLFQLNPQIEDPYCLLVGDVLIVG